MTTALHPTCRADHWVNVYPERQRDPLRAGIWHATPESAADGRAGRLRFGGHRALYVVHVRLRVAA